MRKTNVTTHLILDKRRERDKDQKFPVKLRIIYNRQKRFYNTGHWLTEDEFNKVIGGKPRGIYKTVSIEVNSFESKARQVISEMSVFTFEKFRRLLRAGTGDRNAISWGYNNYINDLTKSGKIGTAETYKYSLNSLLQFCGKENLFYNEITPTFLRNYQDWMIENGKSRTTVGFYLRCLRAILNDAIREENMKKDLYPFGIGKNQYKIPSSRSVKKAIDLPDIKKILDFQVNEGTSEQRARDYWIFSYLSNGMNIKDLALLKYKNIDFANETFSFYRSKIDKTRTVDIEPVTVIMLPKIKSIIDYWGTKPILNDNYIFPILKKGMSRKEEYSRVRQTVKDINKYVNRIAQATGITIKVTTYTARHSFATVLKRSGASIEFISESLGHSDIKITKSYLASFSDESKKDFAKKLIPE
jgi:integrase